MILRDYQESLVNRSSQKLGAGLRKVICQLATGGGKTVIFAAISKRYIEKSRKRILILVHRKELLEQARMTAYNQFGLICEPIYAGMKYIPVADIYVGMVESVNKRLHKLPDIGLVIIDECHLANFNKIHEHFPTALFMGFSATPLAASKKRPLKNYYEDIVCGVDIPDLIKLGFLSQNITWAPKDVVDRTRLAMDKQGYDFDVTQMGEMFSKPKYIHNTVTAYERWALGTKTIIFNVNVFHSQEVTKAFVEAGYNCKHLDGDTSKAERKQILHWFKITHDAVLCNVGIATMGFDEPTIETVIVNKSTASMPLWIQMCGRGSRALLNKRTFTILDMGANAITHGDWCYARDWESIFRDPPKPGKATAAPVKSCPKCEAIVPASTRVCPHCGYVWPAKEIGVEEDLYDFIVVTRGINVDEIIKQHAHRKMYLSFFQIGRQLADDAVKTIPKMSDDYATFIVQKYFELGREWTHKNNKRFNKWHEVTARNFLLDQLKNKYPDWKDSKLLEDLQPLQSLTNL